MSLRTRTFPSLLVLLVLLAEVGDAEAKRLKKQTRDRQFPTGWCALTPQDLLRFTADGPSARIRITASDFPDGIGVDNVYVVAATSFTTRLDAGCDEAAYVPTLPHRPQPFYELFDLEANGWLGANAVLIDSSAPRVPFDDPDEPGSGASALLRSQGFIETTVSFLVPGQSYYLGAWWHWDGGDGAHLTLEVDTLDPGALYLRDGRFRVESQWTTTTGTGPATAVRETDDTGFFWFFKPANLELMIKVLDGCAVNDRYWLFISGVTNVGVTVTVTDTATGNAYRIDNPRGRSFTPVLDTSAFATCP